MIYKENRDDWNRADIVVSTVQSLLFDNKYQRLFSPTDFDLVISDEAHRSIGGNARAVFDYFVGWKLGLTATPRDYLKRFDNNNPTGRDPREAERRLLLDTYRTFGCEDSQPTFRYSLLDGVRDGFLINPTVVDARTEITTELLSEEGFVVTFTDDTGEDRQQAFRQRQFEKRFFAEATNLQALRSESPTVAVVAGSFVAQIVSKKRIAANGGYNLSGERYREGAAANHSFPLVFLGDASLFRVESGGTQKSDVEEYRGGGIPWATLVDLPATDFISQNVTTKRTISEKGLRESSAKMIPANSIVVSTRATIGRIAINRVPIATNQGFKNVVIEDSARALPEFVALALTKLVPTMRAWATGGTFAEISKSKFCELQIPLPPLEVQKEIVAEIDGYQKVINGAREMIGRFEKNIEATMSRVWGENDAAQAEDCAFDSSSPSTDSRAPALTEMLAD